jgi:glycerol uptake facilitator protein
VLMAFGPFLERFEAREGLIRGTPGSERAAMIFGEYFPNPAIFGAGADAQALTTPQQALPLRRSVRPS